MPRTWLRKSNKEAVGRILKTVEEPSPAAKNQVQYLLRKSVGYEGATNCHGGLHEGEVMRFFTVKEVAELLRVSLGTIYGAIDRGELKAHRFGRRTACRISEDSLREFIDGCAGEQQEALPKQTGSFRHLKLK